MKTLPWLAVLYFVATSLAEDLKTVGTGTYRGEFEPAIQLRYDMRNLGGCVDDYPRKLNHRKGYSTTYSTMSTNSQPSLREMIESLK